MTTTLSRDSKLAIGLLLVPSVVCVLLAALHVYNETWRQWSTRFGWVDIWMGSVHSPFYLVLWAVALGNVVLVFTIGFWWLANRGSAHFPHGFFAGWLVAMLVSLIAYLPSNQQYLAASVLILGDRPWQ